jgi:hypothetical protein
MEFGRSRPYMIIPTSMFKMEFEAQSNQRYVWDFFQCFKPPKDLGYDNGVLYKVEDLDPTSLEYRYVAFKFLKTRKGRDESTLDIKKTVRNMIAEGLPADA